MTARSWIGTIREKKTVQVMTMVAPTIDLGKLSALQAETPDGCDIVTSLEDDACVIRAMVDTSHLSKKACRRIEQNIIKSFCRIGIVQDPMLCNINPKVVH